MRPLVLSLLVSVLGCAGAPSAPSHGPAPVPYEGHAPVADPKAQSELDEAERILDAAGSDCAAACGALHRMNKARVRLCTPRTSACEDAERREGAARTHVAAFCECPP